MEEEINYSEVTFKSSGQLPKDQTDDQTIYSEVKIKAPEPEETTPAPALGTSGGSGSPTPDADVVVPGDVQAAAVKGAVNTQHCKLLTASVVALGVLLLVTISLLIYFVVTNNEISAENQGLNTLEMKIEELSKEKRILENKTKELVVEKSILENKTKELVVQKSILENKTKELVVQKSILENKTDELNRKKDSLNWTMGRILMFDSFPVNDFCPQKRCQPCLTGWIQFQEKCYFFYNETGGWKTWTQSQTYCKDNGADLVVIETLQEQEFISKTIQPYQTDSHGFWIGLKQDSDQNWIWVNGHKDTLEFWLDEELGNSGPYALVIPKKPPNASWDTSDNDFLLKFICESELMIKSF